MAALFHRANYPNDVNATVTYVAPIMSGPVDPRFESYMSSVGDEPTREKIRQFQRACLTRKLELLPMLENLSINQKMSFPFNLDEVFEWAVIQFPFSYWAAGRTESNIPLPDASKEQLFELLSGAFSRFTERQLTYNAALYYQQFTELGYHAYPVTHLQDLLLLVKNPNFLVFVPKDARNATFRKDVMLSVLNYLQNDGDNIIYLYGEHDMWTSCAIELTGQTNSIRFVAKDKGHVFNILDLELPEREQVYTALEEWLGVKIQPSHRK